MKITRAHLKQIIKEELEEMMAQSSMEQGVAEAIQALEKAEQSSIEGADTQNAMKVIPIGMEFMRKYPKTFRTFREFKQKVNIEKFPKIAKSVLAMG